jgi:hypothetical protein
MQLIVINCIDVSKYIYTAANFDSASLKDLPGHWRHLKIPADRE